MSFRFTPWKKFRAHRDFSVDKKFLRGVADESLDAFKDGIASPKTGRVYSRGGRMHQASAPGEYPARETGALLKSIATDITRSEATIGTGVFYSKFLRYGTRMMARRKMSDDALKEGYQKSRFLLKGWVKWKA